MFKVGEVVTYKQREDLAEHPTPYRRLGTIIDRFVAIADNSSRFEVHWWDSENTSWYEEKGLDYPSLEAR